MRQVKVTEPTGIKVGRLVLQENDVHTFEDDVAQQFINLGWVECCATGETGERKPGSVSLSVDNVKQKIAAL